MKYPSIRIEGAILSADILDKIEQGELHGQKPTDFWLEGKSVRVKDEIVKAWADAQDMWSIFKRRMEAVSETKAGTTETRNFWIVPLLGLLGYEVELYKQAQIIHGKTYAISHRTVNIDDFPVHIMGFRDSLDKKRQDSGPRMSPHALVQEYINLHEHLYAIVSNGLIIRLLRDSSRLIKLSFIEFDLERMFEEELFADFALLYRLLHVSRMPVKQEESAESLIEGYHQDSLDSGSRIRDGLSAAVKYSIELFAKGFLFHPKNENLRKAISEGSLIASDYYKYQLRFIYRLLFLMVIEERDLIFTSETPKTKRDIYDKYYSVNRIRKLSEKRYLADKKYSDIWINLKNTFRLFESSHLGSKLDIKPLSGDLFGYNAIGILNESDLDNKVLLECLKHLSVFTNPDTGQLMRVNYGSLNVEEFGSVYEGLLEFEPVFNTVGSMPEFRLVKGDERSSSGSHYTPDELVQPLIKHSLEYIIEDRLKESNREKALLSITVCDVACGSGHILLAAARRIATELAKVRTGEDQPSPSAFREAVRDVIRNCIYGVDKNPLAVELAKVALWLEAHNPGEPLHFLDHRIKCGDAIVGLAHIEELQKGIAEEAFKRLPEDDKDVCSTLRKVNKAERGKQLSLDLEGVVGGKIKDINQQFRKFSELPERTPEEIEEKSKAYLSLTSGEGWYKLKTIADIQVAQFFIPKDKENQGKIITDGTYRQYLAGVKPPLPQAIAKAMAVSNEKKFFHWFLEFPEVFAEGGFDCIVGNPPYLGGNRIGRNIGVTYCEYIKEVFQIDGNSDYVIYFMNRIHSILKKDNFFALITSQSIKEGTSRNDGLQRFINKGSTIVFATTDMPWPGEANTVINLISLYYGKSSITPILNGKEVDFISSYLSAENDMPDPFKLHDNRNTGYVGAGLHGDGFVLSIKEALQILDQDSRYRYVIKPLLNGDDLNSSNNQNPSRYVIDLNEFNEEDAKKYSIPYELVQERVYQERQKNNRKLYREKWWHFGEKRVKLREAQREMESLLVTAKTSKHLNFIIFKNVNNIIFDQSLTILPLQNYNDISIVQSDIHIQWSRKFSTSQGGTPRYNASDTIQTFPFPQEISLEADVGLVRAGEEYYNFRSQLMSKMQLGLTKTYNQFHNNHLEAFDSSLSDKEIEKTYGKETANLWKHLQKTEGTCSFEEAVKDIYHLRELHKEMDNAVLKAYDWEDIDLAHDFYEVDYLPENDRIRYTISPAARKEVLKRLLKLNHEIYNQEIAEGLHDKKKKTRKTKAIKPEKVVTSLFQESDADILVTVSYPVLEQDKIVCAAALSIVKQTREMSSADHLDALLLATHPEWCEAFLSQEEISDFDNVIKNTPQELFVGTQPIQWSKSRDYLEKRHAISINRMNLEQPIKPGSELKAVTEQLPGGVDGIVKYALKGLNRINELRKDLKLQTQEQQQLIQILEQRHQQEVA